LLSSFFLGNQSSILNIPLLAAHDPPAPLPLRQALRVINHHIEDYITEARMTA